MTLLVWYLPSWESKQLLPGLLHPCVAQQVHWKGIMTCSHRVYLQRERANTRERRWILKSTHRNCYHKFWSACYFLPWMAAQLVTQLNNAGSKYCNLEVLHLSSCQRAKATTFIGCLLCVHVPDTGKRRPREECVQPVYCNSLQYYGR